MVLEFLETPRFDVDISYGSSGGPGFKTTIFEGHGGVEQRAINWSTSKGRWDVAHGVRDKDDMTTIRKFFFAVKGRAVGFRFKDWHDYQLTLEPVQGLANGTNATFKLIKTYTAGSLSYVRRIFKPVSGTIVIRDDGVIVPLGTGATQVNLDFATGIMVFGASVIPTNGSIITANGEFDTPVRFDTDKFAPAHDGFEVESWSNIPLVELLLEDA